jgi:hypothetical protein
MSPVKKSVTSRVEAGIVEEDFEQKPNDEVIAAGEALPEANGDEIPYAPSAVKVSGMSEEEQNMEQVATVVGPPAYGSPDPTTSAGRLLPLDQHPFNPANLPDDHPAAIDEDYGVGYSGSLSPDEIGTQFPGAPGRTDLENARMGVEEGSEEESNYDSQTKAELLAEAESRGLDVSSSDTKAEIVAALEESDQAA